jgi:hypothetical protein
MTFEQVKHMVIAEMLEGADKICLGLSEFSQRERNVLVGLLRKNGYKQSIYHKPSDSYIFIDTSCRAAVCNR